MKFRLRDQNPPNDTIEGEVVADPNLDHLLIKVDGYGDAVSADGSGFPILIEYHEGKLQVVLWADINKEDTTHVIDMEGARENKRKAGM